MAMYSSGKIPNNFNVIGTGINHNKIKRMMNS